MKGVKKQKRNGLGAKYLPEARREPQMWPDNFEEIFFRELQFIINQDNIRGAIISLQYY